jgi:hypothetical protein
MIPDHVQAILRISRNGNLNADSGGLCLLTHHLEDGNTDSERETPQPADSV